MVPVSLRFIRTFCSERSVQNLKLPEQKAHEDPELSEEPRLRLCGLMELESIRVL